MGVPLGWENLFSPEVKTKDRADSTMHVSSRLRLVFAMDIPSHKASPWPTPKLRNRGVWRLGRCDQGF